jgi:hypothetical protein
MGGWLSLTHIGLSPIRNYKLSLAHTQLPYYPIPAKAAPIIPASFAILAGKISAFNSR